MAGCHTQIMRFIISAVALLLLTSSPAVAASGNGTVVSKVVGEAKDQFITSREVRINDALEQILTSQAHPPPPPKILTGAESGFPAQVTDVLVEWIIYFEAQSFSADRPSSSDVTKADEIVKVAVGKSKPWEQLEVSNAELRSMVERKLQAKSFMKLKTESSLMPVTDSDALSYFKKNRVKFGSMPFETFQDNIKNYLRQQQMDKRMKDWIEVLERKYKVRNFISG